MHRHDDFIHPSPTSYSGRLTNSSLIMTTQSWTAIKHSTSNFKTMSLQLSAARRLTITRPASLYHAYHSTPRLSLADRVPHARQTLSPRSDENTKSAHEDDVAALKDAPYCRNKTRRGLRTSSSLLRWKPTPSARWTPWRPAVPIQILASQAEICWRGSMWVSSGKRPSGSVVGTGGRLVRERKCTSGRRIKRLALGSNS